MSLVVAMIYRGEICLASDTMSTDHETGEQDETAIKQIIINGKIAIGFAGSGNIAQVIMGTLKDPRNADKISKITFNEIPKLLDDIYQSHMVQKQYPNEESRYVSALIAGYDRDGPQIVYWDICAGAKSIIQDTPDKLTAFILNPFDMTQAECNKILGDIVTSNVDFVSLYDVATYYFKVISSLSKFASATATIWTHPAFGIIDTF